MTTPIDKPAMSRCIITGCDLVDITECRWVHGDLHTVGGVWVFNACLDSKGEAAWSGKIPPGSPYAKALHIWDNVVDSYFERRGVIVLNPAACRLNSAAQEYLK
jgi:O-acetylhomoserine/O-acetylserine sulfhydrylase-like pyridoxal-dependent enzyme